jgi:hypothetical protein
LIGFDWFDELCFGVVSEDTKSILFRQKDPLKIYWLDFFVCFFG